MKKRDIQLLKKAIFSRVKKRDVRAIVLFGSRARGDFTEHSDYDINVYLARRTKQAWRLRFDRLPEAFHVHCIDAAQFKEMERERHPFVYCTFRDGIPLYQAKQWFDKTKQHVLAMKPTEKIVRWYFRRGLELAIFIHAQVLRNREYPLPLTLEIEDGKVAANKLGFALVMHHGFYPRSPHTLRREIRGIGERYTRAADAIAYLQEAWYANRQPRVCVYLREIEVLQRFARQFMRREFPEEYRAVLEYEKAYRRLRR